MQYLDEKTTFTFSALANKLLSLRLDEFLFGAKTSVKSLF